MMYLKRTFNVYTAPHGFEFRSAEYATRQMRAIGAKIAEVNESLDARGALMEMLSECEVGECESAEEIRGLLFETKKSLEQLCELDGLLEILLSEWRDVKCAVNT